MLQTNAKRRSCKNTIKILDNTPKNVDQNSIFFRSIFFVSMRPIKDEQIIEKRNSMFPMLSQNSLLMKKEKISLKRL